MRLRRSGLAAMGPAWEEAAAKLGVADGDWVVVDRAAWRRVDLAGRVLREPTMREMVASFAAAMGAWAGAGFPVAAQDVGQERAGVCQGCDLWDGRARFGLGKCRSPKCGCTRLKWWLATSRCPEGKWAR